MFHIRKGLIANFNGGAVVYASTIKKAHIRRNKNEWEGPHTFIHVNEPDIARDGLDSLKNAYTTAIKLALHYGIEDIAFQLICGDKRGKFDLKTIVKTAFDALSVKYDTAMSFTFYSRGDEEIEALCNELQSRV